MRKTFLASVAMLGLVSSGASFAQTAPDAGVATDTPAATSTAAPAKPVHHTRRKAAAAAAGDSQTFAHEPGTGQSGPASMKASNIDEATTRSAIAPHLPQPAGGMNAGWHSYLHDAERAIAMHKTGMAQQALEMAETRLLDRSTPMDSAGQPDTRPTIQQVAQARRALASGDMAAARAAISAALTSGPQGEGAAEGAMGNPGISDAGMSVGTGMAASQPGGAPMGNGTPTSGTMAPTGAGPAPGDTAGARVGGGPVGTGTADSAGGAK